MERVVVYPVSDRETIKKIKHRGEGSYDIKAGKPTTLVVGWKP